MLKLRVLLTALVVTFISAVSADHKSDHSVKERTKPSGSIYRVGDDVPVAEAPVVQAAEGDRDGETIYNQKCSTCHGMGIAGAPKFGDAAAWTDRIAKGIEALHDSGINGFTGDSGVMPAKGGCTDCSDDEIKKAVDYMVEQLK
ncbi:c-type cytochrome [Aliikangiella maris]|uniref:Cytochrome c5 family protein n=2 Tax=Aliikangiella maris TaxID=3162458 RepID=A0ABV3MQB8_9GAMM